MATSSLRRYGTLVALLAAGAAALAADGAMRYEIVVETGMPHLDENLRYATRREEACLDTRDLSQAFPVLRDVSLQDCRLVKGAEQDGSAVYELQCSGGHGTSGQARWQLEPGRIAGTLNVKLGGKNMTFHQRVTGRLAGACARP